MLRSTALAQLSPNTGAIRTGVIKTGGARAPLAAALLGLASMVGTAPDARAADLLTVKAKDPYMRACTAQGEGFYYIPGTDTCIRVGGYAWAEGYYNTYTQYPAENDKSYSVATGGLILDARTETDYGTLRSYFETRFRWRSSDPWSDGPNKAELEVWNIYVQFAGFTFGHAQSFFDFYANANVLGTDPATIGDDTRINLIAYTYEFTKGLSATVSFEDAADRQSGTLAANPATFSTDDYLAGQNAPDVVANLKYEGEWGSAQLSGALHQVRAVSLLNTISATDSNWGYALQAGVMFKLPALGEEDTLYLQTAYTDGATSYLGLQDPSGSYSPPDAFLSLTGLTRVSGWNVTASLLHNWNEKWSSALFGGYAAYEFNDAEAQPFYGASGGKNYNVGGYLAFAPVKHFSIALQYDYTYNSAANYLLTDYSPALSSVSANRVLLFVSRDF
ncbi:porin [Xanthobacter versatilis]|uniref:porin n=1 Tax=Xanthobacter autotrophicus (strain ATCC BAA-1158 / Py2) TaxID=78245 RepID=UPI00372BBFA2